MTEKNTKATAEPTALWKKMIWGMFFGVIVGLILSPHTLPSLPVELAEYLKELFNVPLEQTALFSESFIKTTNSWLALPGALFMGMIKMVVIPLVIVSITLAVASSDDINQFKKLGGRIGAYFIFTTTMAVIIGISLAYFIKPGLYIDASLMIDQTKDIAKDLSKLPAVEIGHSLPKMLIGLFPTNPAQAIIDRSMLQLVIASIIFGLALISLSKKQSKPLIDLCQSGQDVCIKIVTWAMVIAPYAVFGFLCSMIIKLGPDTLIAMSLYIATVLLGLVTLLIMYLTFIAFIAKRSPFEFLRQIRDAQILAFSTSSSAATMPVSMEVSEHKLKVRPHIARFVIPLGTTINMDGTALYQIIAALFLTQVFGIDLTAIQLVLLSVTIIGASIGSPGTPGVGLVILATILSQIGVSPGGVALILGVDRILDMCRTTINVTGDLTASVLMDKWVKD